MSLKTSVQFNPIMIFDTATLTPAPAYQLVGRLAAQTFWLNFANDSNNTIFISYTGANPVNQVLAPNSVYTIVCGTNNNNKESLFFPKNLAIYVASATANAGDLYISYYSMTQ